MTDERPVIRAAQYVRMSTEHQRYSIPNQADVIAAYAQRRGMEIVLTYADRGRSGLTISGRDALKRMLEDVRSNAADYSVILVYDVSRWGRFQDADESAYYEFVCRQQGIKIHYCAEQFENDGSVSSTILKTLRRAMAGEFSRDLSTKVFAGQCRLTTLGFWQGGAAGYGLRRLLVDGDGKPKEILARGQLKNVATDRIILVPGPSKEIAIVRRIYRLFVHERWAKLRIAKQLNAEGIPAAHGGPWTIHSIHNLLTAEKYIGNNVYNRSSEKLKQRKVRNPPDIWVRGDGAFEAIVDADLFYAAQRIICEQTRFLSDEQMLAKLADLLSTRGELTKAIINECPHMPSPSSYGNRFGSIEEAYALIGYESGRSISFLDTRARTKKIQRQVTDQIRTDLVRRGSTIGLKHRDRTLVVDQRFTITVRVIRCRVYQRGTIRWRVPFRQDRRPDIMVLVRLQPGNREILDYYAFRFVRMRGVRHLSLAKTNSPKMDRYRHNDLSSLQCAVRTLVGSTADYPFAPV